jgi:protein farnesyltransferase subunit beta
VHGLTLLGETLDKYNSRRVIDTLHALQNSTSSPKGAPFDNSRCSSGGFGGGLFHLSHWYVQYINTIVVVIGNYYTAVTYSAPNYAAVLALFSVGTDQALQIIDRAAMYSFFLSVKDHPSGGFMMHTDGEVDTRGTYTVIAIARLLNILTPQLIEGVAEYVVRCQTYEGGFGGEPHNEAHGGYNFCALATLFILNEVDRSTPCLLANTTT